jgi:hypothetical protein
MKRGIVLLSMVAVAIGAFALGRAGAQEGPQKKDPAAEMAAWAELAKTGPEHAKLIKSVGTWKCEGKMWMGPGEPTVSTGKAVFSSVYDGRFLKQDYEGTFMGQPDLGIGYTGFNNATKKYEVVWISNMGTGLMLMTGTETAPGTCEFEGSCAGLDGKDMKHRLVLKHVSDDKQVLEMYMSEGGAPEAKCMELTYTRAK